MKPNMKLFHVSLAEGYNPRREWAENGFQIAVTFLDSETSTTQTFFLNFDEGQPQKSVVESVSRFVTAIENKKNEARRKASAVYRMGLRIETTGGLGASIDGIA